MGHSRRSRAEKVAENRSALLEAASRVFRRAGYAAATIDAVADEAGFTKGAVYSHFDSKADLFMSLLEERIEARVRKQVDHLSANDHPVDTATLLDTVWQVSHDDPAWRFVVLEFRLIAARDDALQQRYAAAHRHTIEGVARTIETVFERSGHAPRLPPTRYATLLLALDSGGFLEELVEPGAIRHDDLPGIVAAILELPARTIERAT